MILKKNFFLTQKLFIYFILILFGIYFSFIKGYGQDIDTWREVYSYLELRETGKYIPSRWNLYGHPLAELILGFLTYYLDTFFVNFFIYVLFIASLYFFFITFSKNNKFFFFILCLSNPILVFDNTNISDNVLSLFFFSIGTYLLFLKKNNNLDWSPLFFGFAIASRINFIIYFLILILYLVLVKKIEYKKIINIFFISLLIGSLFYLPIFFQNKLTLNFLYNDAGPPLVFIELLPRFVFKLYQSIGVYSSPLILVSLVFFKKETFKNQNFILIILIFTNLFMFFFIPTKTTILSLSIIFIYILITNSFDKKFIILIIIFNIFSWFLIISFIEVKYKYTDACREIVANDVIFKISIQPGFYHQKIKDLERRILCDAKNLRKFGKEKNYLEGKRMIQNIN